MRLGSAFHMDIPSATSLTFDVGRFIFGSAVIALGLFCVLRPVSMSRILSLLNSRGLDASDIFPHYDPHAVRHSRQLRRRLRLLGLLLLLFGLIFGIGGSCSRV